MGFVEAVGTGFRKSFTFSGRASRSEYWWWTLFLMIGSFLYTLGFSIAVPKMGLPETETMGIPVLLSLIGIAALFTLITFIPTLAVTVRRLHDLGRTGGWIVVPWLLNAAVWWGALMSAPKELFGQQIGTIGGDPLLGAVLMIGASLALLVFSIVFLVWMILPGTKGDNYFGPDPRGGTGDGAQGYAQSNVPHVSREAAAAAAAARSEEVAALYRRKVLGQQS